VYRPRRHRPTAASLQFFLVAAVFVLPTKLGMCFVVPPTNSGWASPPVPSSCRRRRISKAPDGPVAGYGSTVPVSPLFDIPSGFPFFGRAAASSSKNATESRRRLNDDFEGFDPSTRSRNGATAKSAATEHHQQQQQQQNFTVNGSFLDTMKRNGMNEPLNAAPSVTAPEVTHWTEVMSQGWAADVPISGGTSTAWDSDSVLSEYDLQQIEQYWERLLPTVNYLGTEQVAKIYRALCVAYRAHRGQMRKSGDPFIIHPVEVALLLSNLKMDSETVQAGLLHDTVEDTELTFGQIETLFGKTVRSIVEGETKVSKLPKLAFTDYADEQAENLRQMFVAMTDDYRIIIVKLADRLHNMRTLRHMKPEKQVKISRETLDIFAPLAHRMGIWQFKSELEDTAFMYLYPQEYKRLNRRLRQHQKEFRDTLDKSQKMLQLQLNNDPTLQQQAAKVEVFGRTKEIYSLWHKMETKGEHNLDHIVDVVALRVIITPHYDPNDNEGNKSDRGVWLWYVG